MMTNKINQKINLNALRNLFELAVSSGDYDLLEESVKAARRDDVFAEKREAKEKIEQLKKNIQEAIEEIQDIAEMNDISVTLNPTGAYGAGFSYRKNNDEWNSSSSCSYEEWEWIASSQSC